MSVAGLVNANTGFKAVLKATFVFYKDAFLNYLKVRCKVSIEFVSMELTIS